MNRFKYRAMIAEFPFLTELEASVEDEIKVKRLDEKVLAYTPDEWKSTGSLVDDYRWDQWSAILPDGMVVSDFVRAAYDFTSNYAHTSGEHHDGESILEALDRLLEDHPLPTYIVNRWVNHFDTRGRDYEHEEKFVVYKPGRDITIPELIAKAKAQAKAQVQAEATF